MDRYRPLPLKQAVFWFFCVAGLEGIGAAVYLLLIPNDPKNALFLGYSLNRIIVFFLILLGAFGMGYIAILIRKQRILKSFQRIETGQLGKTEPGFFWLIPVFFLSWIIFFLPSYRLQAYQAYYERIYPLLFWLAVIVIQGLGIYFLAYRGVDIPRLRANFSRQTSLLYFGGIVFLLSVGIWLLMGISGLGISPDDRYWNEAGVPLLGLQVLLVVSGSLAVSAWLFGEFGEKKPIRGHRIDFIVGILLWLSAAVIWNLAPFERSYFAPEPVPPNNSYYPFSDAEIYDVGAQFLLIGQGLNNHQYHDNFPFYIFLLAMLRMLGGQDTLRVAGLQAVFLALLPACVYMISACFNRRTAGLIAGVLVILKEYNAIGAVLKIQVSHSRLFMTEMPAALGIALLTLVLVAWIRFPQHRTNLALIGGGVLGIVILVRTNSLFLIPIVLFWIVVVMQSWKMRFKTTLFFLVGIGLTVTPWFLAGKTPEEGTFLDNKINAVITTRYNVIPTSIPGPELENNTPAPGQSNGSGLQSSFEKILHFAPNHFLHNLAMSVLAFPLTLKLDNLNETLKAPYWQSIWDGNLTLAQEILLAMNLAILAIGVGTAFFTAGWIGFLPLTFFIGYHAANAFARTSGSRYLVPVDWVLVLYFGLGLFQIFGWAASAAGVNFIITKPIQINPKPESHLNRWLTILCIVLLASIGSSLLWVGNLIPRRYSDQDAQKTLEGVLADLNSSGIQDDTALGLLNYPGAVVFRGRALYPKFFEAGHGEVCPNGSRDLLNKGYPHLMLRVIGTQMRCVRLPISEVKDPFPDAADVVVIGCEDDKHEVQALAVVVEESNRQVMLRSPSTPWRCPLIPPVCKQDGTCQ